MPHFHGKTTPGPYIGREVSRTMFEQFRTAPPGRPRDTRGDAASSLLNQPCQSKITDNDVSRFGHEYIKLSSYSACRHERNSATLTLLISQWHTLWECK